MAAENIEICVVKRCGRFYWAILTGTDAYPSQDAAVAKGVADTRKEARAEGRRVAEGMGISAAMTPPGNVSRASWYFNKHPLAE